MYSVDWIITFCLSKCCAENTKSKDSTAEYLAFGWGDKGFYLDTPEWSDLKASTAFKAAFALGNSAMHTTFINQ